MIHGAIPNNLKVSDLEDKWEKWQNPKKPKNIKTDYALLIFKEVIKQNEYLRQVNKDKIKNSICHSHSLNMIKAGYAPIHSNFFRKVIGGYGMIYKDFLVEQKWLEHNTNIHGKKTWKSGFSSIWYRVNPNLFSEKCYSLIEVNKTKISEKYLNYRLSFNKEVDQSIGEIRNILVEFAGKVKVDWELLSEDIQNNSIKLTTRKVTQLIHLLKDYTAFGIEYKKEWDHYGERLHTTWTWTFKEARKYLYYTEVSNKLRELDIANSQFYFLAMCFTDTADELLKDHAHELSVIRQFKGKEDIQKFIDWATHGCLYDRLLEEKHKKATLGKVRSRENIKEMMFQSIFSNPSFYPDLKSFLSPIFPSIIKISESLYSESGKAGKLKNRLPRLLQRMESRVMIDNMAKNLIEQGASPFITIHDSFLYQEKDKKLIENVAKETFRSLNLPVPLLR